MFDLVLEGGVVVDGLGGAARRDDVGVRGGRIAAVGRLGAEAATERVDVTGHTVIPGIVDIHSHSDLTLVSDGRARSKIMQGVTTEIVGNCGLGPFPLAPGGVQRTRESISIIDLDSAVELGWRDFTGFADAVTAARPALNVAALVGHVPLRLAVAPDSAGELTDAQLAALLDEVDGALAAGAIGFSTGLMYPPAMSAPQSELIAIGEVVARHDRVFAIHARNYSNGLLAAVDEALAVVRATGCRLQFSHLAVAGRRNWGNVAVALQRIDVARAEGFDVGVDIYPYLAGSANLSQLLPEWSQAGDADAIVARLHDAGDRARIIRELPTLMVHGWDEIVVSWVEGKNADVLGLTVQQIGERWGVDPAEAALDVIRDSHNRAMMVAYGRSDDDLKAVLAHPAASIGSDGLSVDPDGPTGAGLPHPRSYGCYPRLIGRMVRDREIALERAVAMSTAVPASRVGLYDRGRIEVGAAADLVVFDSETYSDTATYTQPKRFPTGIGHVVVAGEFVVRDGVQNDEVRPGRFLTACG